MIDIRLILTNISASTEPNFANISAFVDIFMGTTKLTSFAVAQGMLL